MAAPDKSSLEYLLQLDVLNELLPLVGKQQWQSLYKSEADDSSRFVLWCALLHDEMVESAVARIGWDLRIGEGRPAFSTTRRQGEDVTNYHRYGGREGLRALVHHRSFHGAYPSYCEMDEEFRHYHDLAHDPQRGLLLSFDHSGREIEVARIQHGHVSACLKYLRQYQAGTRHHLAIYVDSVRYSRIPLAVVRERHEEDGHDTARWSRDVVTCDFRDEFETLSRVLFKVILPPPPLNKAGIWPFDGGAESDVSFVIGVDPEGESTEFTSNPDRLSNYFGANPGAPHYLTPVYFRREVLAKYFAEPERYTISDGQVTCLSLWSFRIDNNLKSHVAAFLGDLGRDLPYEERLHWRQFNVPPEGGISKTNFRRSILAEFTEPEAPDLRFKSEYARFSTDWKSRYGWPFFLPLLPGDEHLPNTVRVPVANSQSEMDDQILTLTKLLVDSLNEEKLARAVVGLPGNAKGITKLDAFLASTGFGARESATRFFRDLQSLRSSGSGHRKGSEYEKAITRLGIDPSRKQDAVARILNTAVGVLEALRHTYIDPPQAVRPRHDDCAESTGRSDIDI